MEYTASQIAEILDGFVVGDKHARVSTLAKIEDATEGSLAFLANPKYTPFVYSTKASVILVSESFQPEKKIDTTLVKVSDPYQSFTTMLSQFNGNTKEFNGIHNHTVIDSSAIIGKNSYVGPFTVIQNGVTIGNNVKIHDHVVIESDVVIGDNTVIYSGTKILRQSQIGANCVLHNNVVVGSDGFGFSQTASGSYDKVPQTGSVLIEDDVEIGANTTVDRARFTDTVIKAGSKIDNQVQIAHNVVIGEHALISAQSAIGGSATIGHHLILGGQTGIRDNVQVGNHVTAVARSVITSNIADKEVVGGMPSRPVSQWRKTQALIHRLEELFDRLKKVESRLP